MTDWLDGVRWNDDGLVPAIAQDAATHRVLTRSRCARGKKGERSGHVHRVREIRLDCDRDAILLIVEPIGGIACHTGRERCFYRRLENDAWQTVEPVLEDPVTVYGQE